MFEFDRFKEAIKQIQDVLYGHVVLGPDALSTLHREYGTAIDEINQRLRNCVELLNKGQRSDALQECDVPPNLFELGDVADFNERFLWGEHCGAADLSIPPELEKTLLVQIIDAVPKEAQLARLMKNHRLLALSRSPLRSRLKVLREVQRQDPENKLWRPDIRSYEQVRLKEIKKECKSASGADDLNQLTLLVRELEEADWLTPPSDSLVDYVQRKHSETRTKIAMQELETLAHELNDAFSDLDHQQALPLRERWRSRNLIVQLDPGDPIFQMASPALDWLEREDHKSNVRNEFSEWNQVLNNLLEAELPHKISQIETDRSNLSRHYGQIDRIRTDLADDQGELLHQSTERVQRRLSHLLDRERRIRRNRLVGVVLSIVLVGSLTVWGINHALGVRRASQFSGKIQALIDANQLQPAAELLESVKNGDPVAYSHPDLQEVASKLEGAQAQEDSRLATRRDFVQAIRDRLKENTWESRDEADRLFQELKKNSVADKDSRDNAALETAIGTTTADLQKTTDDDFVKEFNRIKQLYTPGDLNTAEEAEQLCVTLESTPRVTPALMPAFRVFKNLIETDIRTIRRTNRKADLFNSITEAVGNRDRFRGELDNFRTQPDFRNDLAAKHFAQVVENELSLVLGVEEWTKFATSLSSTKLSTLSPKNAKTLSVQLSNILDDHPEHPSAKMTRQLVDYVSSVSSRIDNDGKSVISELEELLNKSVIADLFMLKTKQDKRSYYSDKRPTFSGEAYVIEYFTDLDLSERKTKRLLFSDLFNQKNDKEYVIDSPQSRYGKSTLATITKLRRKETGWHTAFTKMLTELNDDREMEPILKFQLLHVVMSMASKSDSILADILNPDMMILKNAVNSVDLNVNWISPFPEENLDEVRKSRRTASRTIEQLTTIRMLEKVLPERIRKLDVYDLGSRFEWVGWLHESSDKTFKCSIGPDVSKVAQWDLYLLVPVENKETVAVHKIGTYRNGTTKIAVSDVALAISGRPVYAVKTGKQTGQLTPKNAPSR